MYIPCLTEYLLHSRSLGKKLMKQDDESPAILIKNALTGL